LRILFDVEDLKSFMESLKDEEQGHKPLSKVRSQKSEEDEKKRRFEDAKIAGLDFLTSKLPNFPTPDSRINAYLGIDIAR